MNRLVIEPVGLHWLHDEEPTDLCAHGGVRVVLNGKVLFEKGLQDDGFTLSTGALHLLRTIDRDYVPGADVSGQLVPCCGHWMVFDQDVNEVVNSPCPNGIDGIVRHIGSTVEVRLEENASFAVTESEWKAAVRAFSEKVRAFYFAIPRDSSGQMDAEWHPYFVEEWDRRHEAAA